MNAKCHHTCFIQDMAIFKPMKIKKENSEEAKSGIRDDFFWSPDNHVNDIQKLRSRHICSWREFSYIGNISF